MVAEAKVEIKTQSLQSHTLKGLKIGCVRGVDLTEGLRSVYGNKIAPNADSEVLLGSLHVKQQVKTKDTP